MYKFNRVKRGIETFLKTVISEIRDKWNRDKQGLPVLVFLAWHFKIHPLNQNIFAAGNTTMLKTLLEKNSSKHRSNPRLKNFKI